jgi:hypothetical protein
VTASAAVLVLGAGTAAAGNDPDGGGGNGADSGDGHKASHGSCTRDVDKDPAPKETDFPSDHHFEAYKNVTKNDALDSHGKPYYLHNKSCDGPRPWRGWNWHDASYKHWKYDVDGRGTPSYDKDSNTWPDTDGYNGGYDYDEKHLEPKHIGAPKNPKFATN